MGARTVRLTDDQESLIAMRAVSDYLQRLAAARIVRIVNSNFGQPLLLLGSMSLLRPERARPI